MNFYIADTHFGAGEIFARTGRDKRFASMEEMRGAILANINSAVSRDDVLYILGDISCKDYDPTKDLEAIRCRKVLIRGNHDARWMKHRRFRNQFEDIASIMAVRDNDTRIVLCHYPMAEWDGFWKGHWHFYGHVHNSAEGAACIMKQVPRAVNVGVDVTDFMPKTAVELMKGEENDGPEGVCEVDRQC